MAAIIESACTCNCTNSMEYILPYDDTSIDGVDTWLLWYEIVGYFTYHPWIFSLLGSTVVGLTGIFPLWLIPIQDGTDLKTGETSGTLKILLSFAVGALLGDVFLHLLPEAFESDFQRRAEDGQRSTPAGLWILFAFLFFVIFEKLFAIVNEEAPIILEQQQINRNSTESTKRRKEVENNNSITIINTVKRKNGILKKCLQNTTEVKTFLENQPNKTEFVQMQDANIDTQRNGFKNSDYMNSVPINEYPINNPKIEGTNMCLKNIMRTNGCTVFSTISPLCATPKRNIVDRLTAKANKLITDFFHTKFFNTKTFPGYLNLTMNFLDNFTHGLSVGGSFLISFRVGVLSTFAILVHEIPHEVGDFAILLRSGFSRWDAARAQLLTAGGGIVGALTAVFFSGGLEERTSWILPLTAGGFIHIGLVTILPDLMKETNAKESLKQLGVLLLGIVIMAALTFI